jgi:hypothetical protein
LIQTLAIFLLAGCFLTTAATHSGRVIAECERGLHDGLVNRSSPNLHKIHCVLAAITVTILTKGT